MQKVKIGGTYYVWIDNSLKQVHEDKKGIRYSNIIGYCTPKKAVEYLNDCFKLRLSDEDIDKIVEEMTKWKNI